MKKSILSLSAFLAVSMASAQSYISQPDPTTYEIREYKAEQKQEAVQAETAAKETETQTQAEAAETQARDAAASNARPAAAPDKKVAQNRKRK